MSSTTPQTDSTMRRADSMMPNAVVVSAPMARGLEADLNEARREIERLNAAMLTAASILERDGDEHSVGYALRRALTPNLPHEGPGKAQL